MKLKDLAKTVEPPTKLPAGMAAKFRKRMAEWCLAVGKYEPSQFTIHAWYDQWNSLYHLEGWIGQRKGFGNDETYKPDGTEVDRTSSTHFIYKKDAKHWVEIEDPQQW